MNSIGIGIIGFGMAGQTFHTPIIKSVTGLDIRKIRTSNSSHINAAKDLCSSAQIVSENEEIFNDPNIHVVVVVTPNEFHFPIAKKAMESGKHVVIDKPFAITSQQAGELINVSKSTNNKLFVYQNRRWDGDIQTAKKLIESGKLGQPVEAEFHFDRFRDFLKDNWREKDVPGSGILYDLGPHLIDQAVYLFGKPDSVFAEVKIQRPVSDTKDYFDIHLYYHNNLKVILKSSMLVGDPGPRLQIHGTQGSYVKYGMDVQEEALKSGILPKEDPYWGEDDQNNWGTLTTHLNGQSQKEKIPTTVGDYRIFYQKVLASIQQKGETPVDPNEAYLNIRIIELALESSEKGQIIKIES